MQYIDNDMDELFNKAGRDYPLKTDNGDWDAVFGKLQQPAPVQAPLNPKTNRRYYWLVLLLLLPFGYYMTTKQNEELKSNGAVTDKRITTEQLQKPSTNRQPEKTAKEEINSISDRKKPVAQEITIGEEKTVGKEKRAAVDNTTIIRERTGSTDNKTIMRERTNDADNKTVAGLSPVGGSGAEGAGGGLRAQRANNDLKSRNLTFPRIPISHTLSPYSINPPPIRTSQSPPPQKPKHLKTSNIYAGLVFGPDLSTIKYQEIKNTGFSIGLLAGYQFSRHWAVEAGVLYNKKKYFTDGKYFDKAGANIPASVTIDDMDGICEMFEVPISVRYNFSKKHNTLFATAGATSYFMNKEEYEYGAWSGGSWYQGYRSYSKSGNHFFSNVQFSFGYNYNISKKLSLRIEPYIKIPVSDIGIGNLPITSTGLYFGIMRNFR